MVRYDSIKENVVDTLILIRITKLAVCKEKHIYMFLVDCVMV